jgi:hypothetical protein
VLLFFTLLLAGLFVFVVPYEVRERVGARVIEVPQSERFEVQADVVMDGVSRRLTIVSEDLWYYFGEEGAAQERYDMLEYGHPYVMVLLPAPFSDEWHLVAVRPLFP